MSKFARLSGLREKHFIIGASALQRGGEQIPLPKGRPPRVLNEAHMSRIKELYEANNSIYAREIRAELNLECDLGVIYRALAELGLTFKKKR